MTGKSPRPNPRPRFRGRPASTWCAIGLRRSGRPAGGPRSTSFWTTFPTWIARFCFANCSWSISPAGDARRAARSRRLHRSVSRPGRAGRRGVRPARIDRLPARHERSYRSLARRAVARFSAQCGCPRPPGRGPTHLLLRATRVSARPPGRGPMHLLANRHVVKVPDTSLSLVEAGCR